MPSPAEPLQKKNGKPIIWKIVGLVLLGVFLVLGIAYDRKSRACPVEVSSLFPDHPNHGELLVGYKMLAHVLDQETQLKYLHVMRDATFRAPSEELARLIKLIHTTASRRKKELKDLRELYPAVTAPPKKSIVGDGISDHAEASGKKEMIFPKGAFDMRFVMVQAQALRMIVAMTQSIRPAEYNEERKKWLKEVEDEFEGMREQLIDSVNTCHL